MQPSSLQWPPPVGQLGTTTWQNSEILQLIGFNTCLAKKNFTTIFSTKNTDERPNNLKNWVPGKRWECVCPGPHLAVVIVLRPWENGHPGGKKLGSTSPRPEIPTTSIVIGAEMINDIHKLPKKSRKISSGMIRIFPSKIQKIPLLTGSWLLNFLDFTSALWQPKGLGGRRR